MLMATATSRTWWTAAKRWPPPIAMTHTATRFPRAVAKPPPTFTASPARKCHANSGIYMYLYRFYDPSLQRWLNRDPIGEVGGLNLYRFVRNSPITHTDAYGLIMDACEAAKQALAKASDYWAQHPDDEGAALAQAAAYAAMVAACGPSGPPPVPPVVCPVLPAPRPVFNPYGGNPGNNRTFCQNHPWACGGIAVGIGVGIACVLQPEVCAGAVEIGIIIARSAAPVAAGAGL